MSETRYTPSSRLFSLLGGLALLSIACFIWSWVVYLWLAAILIVVAGVTYDVLQLFRCQFEVIKSFWDHQPTLKQPFKWSLVLSGSSNSLIWLEITAIENDIFDTLQPVAQPEILPDKNIVAQWELTASQRGKWQWPGALLRMTTRLALIEKWQTVGQTTISVYPRIFTDSTDTLKPPFLLTMAGKKLNQFRRADQEFESLRPYMIGDNYRHIDWKASSRSTDLVTRQYQLEQHHQILVCLDVSRLMGTLAEGYSKLDWAIEACLHLAYLSAYFKDQMGVLVFSDDVHEWVRPRQQSLTAILQAIYSIKARPVEADFQKTCLNVLTRQKKRSLVIFLSDFLDAGSFEPVLDAFAQLNRKHCGLFVGVEDPALKSHLQTDKHDTSLDVMKTMVAQDAVVHRQVVLKQLQKQGLRAITVTPKNLVQQAMSAYLEIKFQGAI